MTWLGIAAAVFLFVSCIVGYHRGFLKELVSMTFFVLVMAVVWIVNPYVNEIIREATPLYESIQENTQKGLEEYLMEQGELDREGQTSIIDSLPLPVNLKENIMTNNNSEVYQYLVAETFSEYLADYLAITIVNGISFVVSFVLAALLLKIVVYALDIVTRVPVIKGVNRLAGIVMGGIKGILIIWFLLLVVTILCNTSTGKELMQLIEKDTLLSYMYEKNFFVEVFMNIFYGKK